MPPKQSCRFLRISDNYDSWRIVKILISGGTGLIGSALIRAITQNKDQVTLISRTPANLNPELNPIPWNLDRISLEMESTDVVINLAGASIAGSSPLSIRWTPKRKSLIKSSRIFAGEMLSRAIRNSSHKPEVLIQASAIGFYGIQGSQAADESTSYGDDFLAEVCRSWEDSTSGVEELGVRRVITRLGLVLSTAGGLLPLLSLPFKLYLGGPLGNGQQPMSWIHIKDVVQAYRHFIEHPNTQGTYNLTSPVPTNNISFSAAIARTLSRPNWLAVPAVAVKLALGEASTLALEGREVLPRRLLESGYEFQFKQIDSALINLFHN